MLFVTDKRLRTRISHEMNLVLRASYPIHNYKNAQHIPQDLEKHINTQILENASTETDRSF